MLYQKRVDRLDYYSTVFYWAVWDLCSFFLGVDLWVYIEYSAGVDYRQHLLRNQRCSDNRDDSVRTHAEPEDAGVPTNAYIIEPGGGRHHPEEG
mmetsp:Transcript_27673/g.12883  ORF Transcript_27673/g.12883 Transcript_27673/m.12883 type:complete len:94 (-) Transcript_27673:122-403(-)